MGKSVRWQLEQGSLSRVSVPVPAKEGAWKKSSFRVRGVGI